MKRSLELGVFDATLEIRTNLNRSGTSWILVNI